MKEKIISTLKGVAIGDSFGVGIEFQSRFWIKKNVHFDRYLNKWKDGNNNIKPGTYSDDTEHTFGVCEALLSNEPFSSDLLLVQFKHEYERDKALKGYPRDGHGSIEKWYVGDKTIDEVHADQAAREDPGNAPVMRAVPFAFIPFIKILEYATINANSTHPNELARQASQLTVLTAWYFLRQNGDADDLIYFLNSHIDDDQTKEHLKEIDMLPEPEMLTEKDFLILHGVQPLPHIKWDKNIYGMPCSAMKTALNVVYVLKHSTSAFEALKNSINMGGDVDSLAAVCTGISAGKYGLNSLPSFLLEQTEGFERAEILGEKLCKKFF